MKTGKFHAIPEKLADLRALWNRARVLDNDNLPDWLTPEDSAGYRYLGIATDSSFSARTRALNDKSGSGVWDRVWDR